MDDSKPYPPPNPWHPMTDALALKHLGKRAEETAELGAAIARCIIQGVDECEPVTGKRNREWLEDEMADVAANMKLVTDHFNLDSRRMTDRMFRKEKHLQVWHSQA